MLDDTLVAFLTSSINLEIYLRQLTISLSTCQSHKRLHLDLDTQARKPGHKSQQNNKHSTVGLQCLQNMIFVPVPCGVGAGSVRCYADSERVLILKMIKMTN